jgi:hypothetical protein
MNDEALDNLRHLLGSPWFGASEVGEVIDRLARADVMATLVALCGGTVDRERLFALAPRAAFEKIVSYLELSMNTHATPPAANWSSSVPRPRRSKTRANGSKHAGRSSTR